MRFCLHDVPIF